MTTGKARKVLIVGAGVFGISTAYHLLKRGYSNVTVIDKADELPAPDAASSDLNKVVRSSYSDPFYAHFAQEAIELWRDKQEWGNAYHESGVLVLGAGAAYADAAYLNDTALAVRVQKLENAAAIRTVVPPGVKTGVLFEQTHGYLNRDGGWAAATEGTAHAISNVRALGGTVVGGKSVSEILKSNGLTSGVRCADGSVIEANLVVIATGSWTPSTFPELNPGGRCLATGQSIATVQLTEEERHEYALCPVVLDFGPLGFYIFPPNEHGVVKFARHWAGHQNPILTLKGQTLAISTPRTVSSNGAEGLRIPKDEIDTMRKCLSEVYPDLAKKDIQSTRLCWYNDSPDDDWVIDIHPSDPSLVIATAGSGHAYKFLPNIGQLVANRIEGTLSEELRKKFAMDRPFSKQGLYRSGQEVKLLDANSLWTVESI